MSGNACDCKPGTYENGWRETRCDECLQAEIDAWGHVAAWLRHNEIARGAR